MVRTLDGKLENKHDCIAWQVSYQNIRFAMQFSSPSLIHDFSIVQFVCIFNHLGNLVNWYIYLKWYLWFGFYLLMVFFICLWFFSKFILCTKIITKQLKYNIFFGPNLVYFISGIWMTLLLNSGRLYSESTWLDFHNELSTSFLRRIPTFDLSVRLRSFYESILIEHLLEL